jgi:hypothetical protein
MDDSESIRTDELRQFSRVMSLMSAAYASLADWLEAQNVTEIPGGGTQTAKLGLRYLGGFTGTVLKAYSKSLLGDGEDGPPEIASGLVKAETATKAAAKTRAGITPEDAHQKHEPDAEGRKERQSGKRKAKKP